MGKRNSKPKEAEKHNPGKNAGDGEPTKPGRQGRREPDAVDAGKRGGDGESMKQSAKARALECRHRELIRKCIQFGSINYDKVSALYVNWFPKKDTYGLHEQFKHDCFTLESKYKTIVKTYIDFFFLPTPKMEYNRKKGELTLVSGRRPIAVAKHVTPDSMKERPDQVLDERLALAKFAIDARMIDAPERLLIPREGRVYAGIGSSVCFVFRALLDDPGPLQSLTVFTNSMEVASLLYYQHVGAKAGGLRVGGQLYVDSDLGSLVADDDGREIEVAVISCNGLKNGSFYSTARTDTSTAIKQFLDRSKRIVIVAEHWKIGKDDGYGWLTDSIGKKPVCLITDAEKHQVEGHLPAGVDRIFAPRPQA